VPEEAETKSLSYPDHGRPTPSMITSGTKVADPASGWKTRIEGARGLDRGAEPRHFRLSRVVALRSPFQKRITELWNYPRPGARARRRTAFYSKNSGLQRQAPLFARELTADPVLVIDPNSRTARRSRNTSLSRLTGCSSTECRKARGLGDLRVRDIDGQRDLADDIRWMPSKSLDA
jgi:hypothetical protein